MGWAMCGTNTCLIFATNTSRQKNGLNAEIRLKIMHPRSYTLVINFEDYRPKHLTDVIKLKNL